MSPLRIPETLIAKYDVAAPRYTSYPPIPYWPPATPQQWEEWIATPPEAADPSLSLYLHVPFCPSRCHYCGCYVVITRRADVVARYVEALKAEMALVRRHLGTGAPVRQVHLGGGTPSYLSDEALADLVATARRHFPFEAEPEMSIEVDPRSVTPARLAHLRELGFNRLSLGVQDTDLQVLSAVNREQSYEHIAELMLAARALDYAGVNLDLIYGLPHQTPARFARTLEEVDALGPDRLALYSFAHLPERLPHQRRIDAAALPEAREKLELFHAAHEFFTGRGYQAIGLDHFARPGDDLAEAQRAGTMQRNFMGYTTQAGTELLAFGVSGISDYNGAFWQNEKKLNRYYNRLDEGRAPVVRGMRLDAEDRLRKALIAGLFCGGRVDFADLQRRFGASPQRHFASELEALDGLERDGLVRLDGAGITVTALGQFFLRNIAVVFDAYHGADQDIARRFSRTV